jgi:hypothetical protein
MVSIWMLGAAAAAGGSPTEPSLAGRHVMRLHVVSRAKIPLIGWVPTRTVTTVLVDLRDLGEHRYQQRHQVCDIEIINTTGQAEATIPLAFVRAMPIKVYRVDLTPKAEGWSFVADLGEDHIGYDPSMTRVVPGSPRDLGVIDADHDDKPGMTVVLRVPVFGRTELYVAQHGWMRAQGTVQSPDRVEGALEVVALEQRTLKASNPLLGMSPRLEAVPGASWFTLERAPGATCERLRGLRQAPG